MTQFIVTLHLEREVAEDRCELFDVRVAGDVQSTKDEWVPSLMGLESDSDLVTSLEDLTPSERHQAEDKLCEAADAAVKAVKTEGARI